MKKIFLITLLFPLLFGLNGCKDFLNVEPVTNMSGNNFWQTKKDVEQFTRGLYDQLRTKVVRDANKPGSSGGNYFLVVGDLRCSPWLRSKQGAGGRFYIDHLASNDIRAVLSQDAPDWDTYFGFSGIGDWRPFYEVIQGANAMYEKIDDIQDPSFSEKERKKYKAEAVFIRNMCYFFMVRMYGDVPYYTDAYHSEALERMPMVQVLKNCVADLDAVTEDLPWTYDDPAERSVRAMKGSALILSMHMNMWLAGFDDENKESYWRATDSLGAHLLNDNGGSYKLLPLEEFNQIFEGRTKEGLFEIPQNLNYGESFGYATFSDLVLHDPYKTPKKSYMYPNSKFLDEMFPPGQADERAQVWFKPDEKYKTDGEFQYLKFTNVFQTEGEDFNPDDNAIIFRLADAILLRAEALNDLGKDDEARDLLNRVRDRAHAQKADPSVTGSDLSDMIYWERCRELLGEGYYYYTLVRTKKILDKDYCWHPMTVSAFQQGAWTWPISDKALIDNPGMVLNTYWTR